MVLPGGRFNILKGSSIVPSVNFSIAAEISIFSCCMFTLDSDANSLIAIDSLIEALSSFF